ncbi:hypothetical protein ACJMK2_033133 [Sinanodonta woodiana]|uniref:NTR domain-containing protein n=1 Tax=Sinanodonta woodiana TaxID=1069815 RepID=A0ABD3X5Q9_SINWO
MEKIVMFIQCLLMLLVAIQLTSACTCSPPTLDEAMCGSNPVLMLTADTDALVDSDGNLVPDGSAADYTKYELHIDEIYKNGSNGFTWKAGDDVEIIIPHSDDSCGVILDLDTEYYVSGSVKEDGTLDINKCGVISKVEFKVLETDESKDINDLLTGVRKPRCGKRRRLLRKFP